MIGIKVDEDLFLKIPDKKYANELFNLSIENKIYLQEWLPWVPHVKEEKNSLQFLELIREQFFLEKSMVFLIFWKLKLVGIVGFNLINKENNSAPIGYWIGEKYQKNGIINRSCKKILEVGFKELNLNKIIIRADPNNSKSLEVAKKLNFTLEFEERDAEFRNSKYHSLVQYSILKSEWSNEKKENK